ncbi:hypothetical protein KC887_01390 [Candidatus Kaiserbacteria bacterium]|nr:hypothetical protein [Candidatus Kaiserbacteria bacterium]
MAENTQFTPIPNCLLDRMAQMKPAEFKALMAIYRLIIGYQEYRDKRRRHISITKLQKFVGLSRQGVINAMSSLEEYGYVTKVETDGVNEWVVNSVDHLSSQDSVPVVNSVDGTSQDSLPPSNKRNLSKENNNTRDAESENNYELLKAAVSSATRKNIALLNDSDLRDIDALFRAGHTAEQVNSFFGDFRGRKCWWYLHHWKGQKGQAPKLTDILESIGEALVWAPSTNGTTPHTNGATDKNIALENIRKAVKLYGAQRYKQAMSILQEPEQAIVKKMAPTWRDVCMMDASTFQVRYYQALKGA